MEVGYKIRKVREWKDYTQEYMAERMGITQSGYSAYEKENSDLTLSQLKKISDIFGMKLEELLNLDAKNVFNNYGESLSTSGVNSNIGEINYNGLAENERELFKENSKLLEDKVKLLEEKINLLLEKIAFLEKK